jgi:Tol biopolymer transport system component
VRSRELLFGVVLAMVAAVTLLALGGARQAEATHPGANDEIVFVSDRDGGDYEIYVMNPDGSNQRRLTYRTGYDIAPAWSPGGKIAFERHSPAGPEALYTMNADGSGQRRVAGAAYDPAWSPSGRKIVFDAGCDLYTINPDGSGRRNITSTIAACAEEPAWSPNGGRIAFSNDTRPALAHRRGIYTITTRGTGLRRLTFGNHSHPNWSPDGARLVFDGYDAASGTHTISTVDADGTGPTTLTSGSVKSSPIFSPDGTKVAYYGIEGSVRGYQVFARNADGSGTPTALTSTGNNLSPDWRPGP